jgi:hypothetical protein
MTKGNKYAKALQDNRYRQRVVSKKKRVPYWSAKEVIDNDWKTDGLTPMGYYDEIITENEDE